MRQVLLTVSLLWAGNIFAALYTVGPDGTHATVQDAVNASWATPESDEIRVAAGIYTENLFFLPNGSGRSVTISGGWNSTFDTVGATPSTIDGGASDRVFDTWLGDGDQLTLSNLRFQNGSADTGAGLLLTLYGSSEMTIDDCEIANNISSVARADGAGISVSVTGSSQFSLLNSSITGNQSICSGDIDCRSGGIGLYAENDAQIVVNGNEFIGNSVAIASGSGFGGGGYIIVGGDSSLNMADNHFVDNTVSASDTGGLGVGLGIIGSGQMTVRRIRFEANNATIPFLNQASQLTVAQYGSQITVVTDSVFVKGNGNGIRANVNGDGTPVMHLVNLTAAENSETGIWVTKSAGSGTMTLSNSIAVDNGLNTNIGPEVSTSNNLVSGSAGFVNAVGGDYSLLATSNAIDAGNNTPPGDLGPTDFAGNPRINNAIVDIGAYEFESDVLFEDGFESLPTE